MGIFLLMQFNNKVHPIVTNLAKNLNGYYLISFLFLENIVPDVLNPKISPTIISPF